MKSFQNILWIFAIFGYMVPIYFWVGVFEIDLFRISITIAFIIFLLKKMFREGYIRISANDFFILVSFLILFSSFFWSYYKYETARYCFDLIFFLMLYFVIKNMPQSIKIYIKYVNIFYYIATIQIFLIVFCLLSKYGSIRSEEINLHHIGPNQLAQWGTVCLSFLLLVGYTKVSFLRRTITYILSAILVFIILMTGSRSGFIGLIILFVLSIVYLRRFVIKTLSCFVLSFFVFFALFTTFYNAFEKSFVRIESRMPLRHGHLDLEPDIVGKGRFLMYVYGLETLRHHWIKGISFGVFKTKMEEIFGPKRKIPHNVLLRVWLGGGIIAVSFFVLFIVFTIKNGIRVFKYLYDFGYKNYAFIVLSLTLGFICLVVEGMFNPILYNPFFYLNSAIISKFAEVFGITKVKKIVI